MKELKSIGWYAAHISSSLPKEAFKPVPTRLWGGAVYLGIVIGGLLTITLFDLNIWLNFVTAFIIGTSFASLGFLGHEILHGTVIRLPWLRDLLGAIAFLPLVTEPKLWRKWHNGNHHVYTQDQQKDPDAWPNIEKISKSSFLIWIYKLPLAFRSFVSFSSLSFSFTLHSSRMFLRYLMDFRPSKRVFVLLQLVAPIVIWLTFLFIIGPTKWFFAYLLPFMIANFILMGYISTNHRLNPIVNINDPLANSLSVTVPKWVDFLHFNFSYHTEHHLFPGMSPKYYPLVKAQIKKNWPEQYNEMSLITALKALWLTPRVYYQNNELVDPSQGYVYGSLGNGLDPLNVQYRQIR